MSSMNDDSAPLPPMATASKQPTSHFSSPGASEGETLSSKSKVEKKKGVQLKAESWNHFTMFVNDDGVNKAKCNYCGKEYVVDAKFNGTSSIKKHMDNCKAFPHDSNNFQMELIFQSGDGSLGTWKFS